MEEKNARELIRKYLEGQCSPEEAAWVESWYLEEAARGKELSAEPDYEAAGKKIRAELRKGRIRRKELKGAWYRAAAAVLILALAATGYVQLNRKSEEAGTTPVFAGDLPPGGNKAILTLGNGKKIILEEAADGRIAEEGGTLIRKANDGRLVYDGPETASRSSEPLIYNTIETPPGGQYRVILPDGTQVWLNASSSLRYPARFESGERRVALSGEGYFEVARDEKAPFFVNTSGLEAEVLGTRFNIHAYGDEEAIIATLLEGSLLVGPGSAGPGSARSNSPGGSGTSGEYGGENHGTVPRAPEAGDQKEDKNALTRESDRKKLLRPGQEAVLESEGALTVREADTELAVAWKNGLFKFKRASVETVMRQLARWYDVEIVFKGALPEETFTGEIYRNLNASQVLDILRYTDLDFRIEDKKIIVTN